MTSPFPTIFPYLTTGAYRRGEGISETNFSSSKVIPDTKFFFFNMISFRSSNWENWKVRRKIVRYLRIFSLKFYKFYAFVEKNLDFLGLLDTACPFYFCSWTKPYRSELKKNLVALFDFFFTKYNGRGQLVEFTWLYARLIYVWNSSR